MRSNPTFDVMLARDRNSPLLGQGHPWCPPPKPEGTIQPRQLWAAQTEGMVYEIAIQWAWIRQQA